MWNNTIIDIVFEKGSEQSEVIRTLFLSKEDVSNGERLDNSIKKSENKYTVTYSQNHYSDREEILFLSKELAKAQTHCPFSLSSHSWNEGAGGNYTEEIVVAYRYGTISTKFYSNSELYIIERGSEDSPEPRLVEATISQLFPKTDFVEDIADPVERERFLNFSIVGENKFFVDNGTITKYQGPGEGDLLIPDGITSIRESIWNNGVFGNINIKSATIPKGVTHIGSFAFRECKNLTYVSIPDSVKSIGFGAFFECENLTSISIPEGVTNIGDNTFYHCAKITSLKIPKTVTSIGRRAFSLCRELSSISIPDGVTTIDESTFQGCWNLTSVIIPDSVTTINKRAFYACGELKDMTIPNSVLYVEDAFQKCRSLRGLLVPEAVKDSFLNMKPDKFVKVVLEGGIWSVLAPAQQGDLFLKQQGKAVIPLYLQYLADDEVAPLGEELLNRLQEPISAKECNAIGTFLTIFYSKLDKKIIQGLYHKLQNQKNGKNAVKVIETNTELIPLLEVEQ